VVEEELDSGGGISDATVHSQRVDLQTVAFMLQQGRFIVSMGISRITTKNCLRRKCEDGIGGEDEVNCPVTSRLAETASKPTPESFLFESRPAGCK